MKDMNMRTSFKTEFKRFFSTDSTKAVKAQGYNYLNGINYMAPATAGGVGNLCPNFSKGCLKACLGLYSGQAAMVDKVTKTNLVRESRKRKARYMVRNPEQYMREFMFQSAKLVREAKKQGLTLCLRPNGSTDVDYENKWIHVDAAFAALLSKVSGLTVNPGMHTVFSAFPSVQFVDYTKRPERFDAALPANYHLTFSRSETNEAKAIELLGRGINVAVVFAALPETWNGFPVINGDSHDLRHLDPRGGVVVGLLPKGLKAKRDTSGFIVR